MGILAALLGAGFLAAQDREPAPPLAGTGPMRELLARGVAPAPMTSGLAFALTITRGGRDILAGPWSLRVPGASPLTLSLEEPAWEADALEAVASLRNGTGAFVGGARLDFLEISQGSSGRGGRAISLPSPLFFGDLQPGGEASLPFRLEPLGLTSDSPNTVIRGIVTGVVAAGTADLPDSADPVAIDAAGGGVFYVGDGAGKAIFRVASDLETIRKYDAGCPVTGIAARKKSGEVLASCREVPALVRLATSGKVTRTDPLDRPLGPIRLGGKESLYGAPEGIVRLDGLVIAEQIGNASRPPLRPSGFDVAPDGTIWAVRSDSEGGLLRIRSAKDVVSLAGAGEGLGALRSPASCRVGPDGFVYVLEAPAPPRPPRVSVFDRSGSLARAWLLRAGRPVDLAFFPDGRLAVLSRRERGSAVSLFRIF